MRTNLQRFLAFGILCSALLGLVCSVMAAAPTSPVAHNDNQSDLGKAAGATLSQILAAGLKCRRQVEFDYVKMVAKKVDNGTLPHALVESTFFWAREKRDQYPFISFRFALEARAKKIGIIL